MLSVLLWHLTFFSHNLSVGGVGDSLGVGGAVRLWRVLILHDGKDAVFFFLAEGDSGVQVGCKPF